MNTTRRIAEFAVGMSLQDVPAPAIDIAKGGMIDSLGCAIAGAGSDASRIVTRWTRAFAGKPSSGVIGGGFRTAPDAAARANGTIGQALDFDPPLPLVPVVLALGESEGRSGRDILEAYIAGFEVQSKLQNGVSQKHTRHGWHSNTVFGTIAASVSAAKLMKLDVAKTQMAIGIAASATGGLLQNLGTMTKPLHAGMAAANGIVAAGLAREGFDSAPDALEGKYGVLRVYATEGEYEEHQIAATFGAPWDLLHRQIRIKPYPCCRWGHRPLDALLALVRERGIDPMSVEAIDCVVDGQAGKVMNYAAARNALEAKFCLPYCLAVAVIDRKAGLQQFTDERAADGRVQELAKRVNISHPEGGSELETGFMLPSSVRLHLKGGTVLQRDAGAALGDPGNPMSIEAIANKYRECTRGLLPPEKSESLLSMMQEIEALKSLKEVARVLTFDLAQALKH